MLLAGRRLLDLCDAERDAPPASRAIAMLAACAQIDLRDAAALDIGTFHARMLDCCQARYGERFNLRMVAHSQNAITGYSHGLRRRE